MVSLLLGPPPLRELANGAPATYPGYPVHQAPPPPPPGVTYPPIPGVPSASASPRTQPHFPVGFYVL